MRAMIVEDEDAIREGIVGLIDWKAEGFDELVAYSGAVDALDDLEVGGAELILTDIFMQVLSGLEFIEMAKKVCPGAYFIILTGYERFEYAQKAIELGVAQYLLKPVTPEKLTVAVRDAVRDISESRRIKDYINIAREKLDNYMLVMNNWFWSDILSGGISDPGEIAQRAGQAGVFAEHKQLFCVAVRIQSEDIAPVSRLAVRQIIKELLGESGLLCVVERGGLWLAALTGDAEDRTLERLCAMAEDNLGLCVCVGVGRPCDGLNTLYLSAYDAEEAARSVTGRHKAAVMHSRDIQLLKKHRAVYPSALESQLLDGLRFQNSLDRNGLSLFLNELLVRGSSTADKTLMLTRFLISLYNFAEEYSITSIPAFSHMQQLLEPPEGAPEKLKDLVSAIFDEKCKSQQDIVMSVVNRAKAIMDEEYSNAELSVGAIARQLCITPNYLSRIFKGATGATCVEYLTAARMAAAKKLLLRSSSKSYAISQMVGYNNPNYFSALFKKHVGLSPREFREEAGA